ncbi:cysteine proteinase [Clavulina sp. PMI_390]|nr:cysteine proteinase [Clavulina sp. PMI_390]
MAPSPPVDAESSSKKGSKQRFKEREQRKAQAILDAAPASDPEADARLEREAKLEEKSIGDTCSSLGLQMFEINPDGHCLFSAVADQLVVLQILQPSVANYATTRKAAADYMFTHQDDFLPFLPSLGGEDGAGSTDAGMMTPEGFKQYCKTIRDTGMWGGEPEIMALSRAYNVAIYVVQTGPPPIVKHSPIPGGETPSGTPIAYISYHRRMYGLGEHYNSLRPKASIASRIIDKVGL